MAKYKMLLGEPCRCYYKNDKGEYSFQGIGYYVGNGYCIRTSFTEIRDNLNKNISPTLWRYDRYIPTRLWNSEYEYAKARGVLHRQHWNLKEILLPNFSVDDFNTNVLEDVYYGHLDEFWWWLEIQREIRNLM